MLDEKYGVTLTGFSRKRLDEIINEIHDDLSEGFGFDTRANPKSFLGVLVTNFADKIAELWEVGEQKYNSQVPSSAEGVSLDRVGQLGGSFRKNPTPSVYTILCTGDNGTVIPEGTRIKTETNPAVELINTEKGNISSDDCVYCEIMTVGTYGEGDRFSISVVDSDKFEIVLEEGQNPIEELYKVIKKDYASFNSDKNSIELSFAESVPHTVLMSSNLTASSVTSLVQFSTVESGDIALPKDAITSITTGVSGLKKVTNLADYIKGWGLETDSEFRKSYVDKIFIRSRTMLESIKSAILANCNGVESVEAFENDTNEWDLKGCFRAPHSVEVVVIGGDPKEIAEQIFATKAAGINTSHCLGTSKYCDYSDERLANKWVEYVNGAMSDSYDCAIEETIKDDYNRDIVVRFSRPVPIYYKIDVSVDAATNEQPAANTFELIQDIIIENVNALSPGDDLVPQKFLAELYKKVPGVMNYQFNIKPDDYGSEEGSQSIQGLGYNMVARCRDKSKIQISWEG